MRIRISWDFLKFCSTKDQRIPSGVWEFMQSKRDVQNPREKFLICVSNPQQIEFPSGIVATKQK